MIPLLTPFPFNAAAGLNLLLDVTIPTCPDLGATTNLDAEDTPGDSVSRVFASDSSSATGSTSTLGLVTQFIGVSTSIPTLSEWAMIGMVLILVGIAVRRVRRRPAFNG